MKRFLTITTVFLLCLLLLLPVTGFGRELVAVGQVIGLELRDGSVTVAAIDEEWGQAARDAGVRVGDRILKIDSHPIHTAQDVRDALAQSKGTVTLNLRRGKEELTCSLQPAISDKGPKLGLYLRQGSSGIGTVTWYDPDTGAFGALGHGVNQAGGQLLQLTEGTAFRSAVVAVRKGKAGEPGQLMGGSSLSDILGTLQKNTLQGVFGTANQGFSGRKMETAQWDQIQTGPATILSTVSGAEVREYSVEILKIYPNKSQAGRNFLIRVTDQALLDTTGGIVQGMSGSPIIQDGKLIGAVTHVLVNDPTTGYGIFIENMLDAAA